MTVYSEKLKSPKWQKRRLEILQRDEFTCMCCGGNEDTLNVHHTYYEKGKNPWDYPVESLQTLCEGCHKWTEDSRLEIMKKLNFEVPILAIKNILSHDVFSASDYGTAVSHPCAETAILYANRVIEHMSSIISDKLAELANARWEVK